MCGVTKRESASELTVGGRSESEWAEFFQGFIRQQGESDAAHDLGHIQRVVANSRRLCEAEGAEWTVVMPAAWLHDCVPVAKDSPLRSQASRLSAERAAALLKREGYPLTDWECFEHVIISHSFSARVEARSLEAKVLQDADRIDALGAIGLSRCLMLGGEMGSELMSPSDPFCVRRQPDDSRYAVDHFYRKLLLLEETMQTASGRELAKERSEFLNLFLAQLQKETA